MFNKAILLALAAVGAASVVNGQTIPDVSTFPSACATDCASTVEVAVLCESDYTNSTDIAACFCVGLPSSTDLSTCETCLNSNGASDLGTTLTTAATACPAALQTCAFECDITQCASSDIACQCSLTYLQEILQCASCNTANNNTGTTLIADYDALAASCEAQNYTATPTGTTALPSPTGQSTYVAPSLTGTGSGSAAASAASGTVSVGASTTVSVTGSVTGSTSKAATSSGASTGSTKSSTATASTAASTTSAAASSGKRNAVAMGLAGAVFGAMGLLVIA